MSASLVGSEMCIRDSLGAARSDPARWMGRCAASSGRHAGAAGRSLAARARGGGPGTLLGQS
eukprot:4864817-Alexandrium_andersonii.AAC.1